MAELADAHGLGPCGEILGGSTPLPPTNFAEGEIDPEVPLSNATAGSIVGSEGPLIDVSRS